MHTHSRETAGKLANFLKAWLTRHILGADKKYAPYVHKATAAPSAAPPAAAPAG